MVKLTRIRDGLTKEGNKVSWVKADPKTKYFKEFCDEPEVGAHCLLFPYDKPTIHYRWCTSEITSVTHQSENKIEFKTKNSTYVLTYE